MYKGPIRRSNNKNPLKYKKGDWLQEISDNIFYEITIGGNHGVYIEKNGKGFYIEKYEIEKSYKIFDIDKNRLAFLDKFKSYFLNE